MSYSDIARMSTSETPYSLAPMIETVVPSVVNIATVTTVEQNSNPLLNNPFFRRFFNVPEEQLKQKREMRSAGSGVIVDTEQGFILTNAHVIKNADLIEVSLSDEKAYTAELIGQDEDMDLALIKIDAPGLTAVKINPEYDPRVGDFVVAIGNPFGLGQTITSGIIGAKGRSGLGLDSYQDFIQTDASINPGNSGGALVNLKGELVGINTAIYAPSGGNIGIGFAIPAPIAARIMEQLIMFGEVRRGVVGVVVQNIDETLSEAIGLRKGYGVLVNQVTTGSPADQAGLQAGDVILSIDSRKIRNQTDLSNILGLHLVGDTLVIEVFRQGEIRAFQLTVAEPAYQNVDGESLSPFFAGAKFSEVLSIDGTRVEISELEEDSLLAQKGLQKNDRFISVNDIPIVSVQQIRGALAQSPEAIFLKISRDDTFYHLTLR
ncbi:MAG: Do family serine endopeptidase [Pseudomonadota bacterium]|nr:Do family serine endopeptidase [Pseudomonadota bacterium]